MADEVLIGWEKIKSYSPFASSQFPIPTIHREGLKQEGIVKRKIYGRPKRGAQPGRRVKVWAYKDMVMMYFNEKM